MRYEVVARKGLLLREGYATDSDKVCEARKGSFVVALGPQRDVGGVCRLEVVTPEGLRGWCSLKAQLLAPRDDEQPSAERPWPSSRAGGAGLVAIASSASGFEVASSRRARTGPARSRSRMDGSDLCDLDLPAVYAAKWPTADIIRYVEPTLVRAPLRCVAAARRSSASALGLSDPDDEAPILLHARGNAGLRTYAKLLERLRRSPHAKAARALQRKRVRNSQLQRLILAVFHSFWLIFGRAIISWNGLDAWVLFPERARAAHLR
ncbi:hypothetical protein JL721_10548 [Aureococcus anophagefferens]|nr:hypothetical protein JL721_10548 [Aureococcus anophagefferens]